ncbi:MAG TPA: carboxypeptidase-like regulatory domain-containing protein [Chitinophagales bacterium]|nr:carboxypeptidase-like regulatory domain-containing protein [Chitinophagales bacterium]
MFKRLFVTLKCLALFTLVSSASAAAAAAQTVSGMVKDEKGEPLFAASVIVKGTSIGAQTDFEGEFEFNARQDPPFTLVITYLGYQTKEFDVTASNIKQKLTIVMQSAAVEVKGVEVKDLRITERQKESPLTIESMGLAAIKQTPAADFYTGLGTLKGVDLTTASLGFVIINTRGFNSTRPVRSLQLVDGADNQAPGLNFSLGNFAGSPELDIQKVDLIVGASSALYGPNAFNGVINMSTKSPFLHKGLMIFVKGAERKLFETGVRYARVIANEAEEDKFAFKINFSYLRADDWEATNLDSASQSQVDVTNPGGYDAVNRYGDENLTDQTNNFNSKYGRRNYPGLGIFYRTGYEEKYLVDYDTRNFKTGASLHYRINKDIELITGYNFGTGTTVYQGENRYSLKGLKFHQVRLEMQQPNRFYVRAYSTMEDAGDTYDAVFTAFKLQDYAKDNIDWSNDYSTYWIRYIRPRVKSLPGYPQDGPWWFDQSLTEDGSMTVSDSVYRAAALVLEQNYDSLVAWHRETRLYADGKGNPNFANLPRLQEGTAEFDSVFNVITTSTSFEEGGTKFYDKSKLVHLQGEYKFTPKFMDINVGASYRLYLPKSNGTIFSDTTERITNWEYGIFGSLEKKVWLNRLIFTISARLDKNKNFDYLASPAASIVYRQNDQTFRFSFSSALRNPTLQDQYLYYNVGRAILIGNISGVDSLVTVESLTEFFETGQYDDLVFFDVPPVRPERVKSVEVGYRGILFENIYADGSFYYSWYKDFLGYRIGVSAPNPDYLIRPVKLQPYRVSANSPDQVVTYGFSIAVNYYFLKNYSFSGNYSWNVLDKKGSDDPIIPAYNTPEHKFNVGISGKEISFRLGKLKIKNVGFNFNYKWIQGFQFEGSPQFTGYIPTYGLLDGQINYTNKKIYTTFKLGASNILNNRTYQTYGGPYVGRMIYFSLLFEMGDL